jgi:phospholipid N-methyltransferase
MEPIYQVDPTAVDGSRGAKRRWRDNLLFVTHFFRHPRMLGSMIPSSRFLIRQLLAPVDWSRARVIVEFGPGVGVITREMLKRMRADATLIAIELNPDFVRHLRSTIEDARLVVRQGSAIEVEEAVSQSGAARANYVISGIPFSTMPADEREVILNKTRAVLESQGLFLVYQFSSSVLGDLRRIFRDVTRRFEPLNILPAHLYFCSPGLGIEGGHYP